MEIGRFNGRSKRSMLADINMTPFVDVMLVLLIIFMITAPMLQQGMPVNLPQAQAPALKRSKKDVIITIKSDGKIYVGDSKTVLNVNALENELKNMYSVKQQKDLFIKADANIKYGTVMSVMSAAKKAGVGRIGMLTQPEYSSK